MQQGCVVSPLFNISRDPVMDQTLAQMPEGSTKCQSVMLVANYGGGSGAMAGI